MSSLSERAAEFVKRPMSGLPGVLIIDERWELVAEMAAAIEKISELNCLLSAKCELMQLRIEELEAQLTALAPSKESGPIIG